VPKVSVIIPNYNHSRFLEKRIQSVLNQTYQDFEVIYLDDASTDNSHQVFAKFVGDKRICATCYNQVNSGSPFKQWNKGVRKAKGEYVWIAESDDYADERLLAELVTRLDKHPKIGIVYCQSWKVDENDNILSSMQERTADLDEQRWKKDFVNNGKDECSRYLIFKCTIPNASAVLIRRTVYESVGGADESMRYTGDWMLWAKVLLTSDITFVAEPLNYYRKHENSVTSNSSKDKVLLTEYCQIVQYIAQNVQVGEAILEKVFDRTIGWWLNTILQQDNLRLKRNQRVYSILSNVDRSRTHRLIICWLFKVAVKKSGSAVNQVCKVLLEYASCRNIRQVITTYTKAWIIWR
jgi:glycosyltransferase involved in cell wall biosynthesis